MICQKVTFSTVLSDELAKAGVQGRLLNFVAANLADLQKKMLNMNAGAQIADLHSRIKEIYACVNMDVCLGFTFCIQSFKSLLACRMNQAHA